MFIPPAVLSAPTNECDSLSTSLILPPDDDSCTPCWHRYDPTPLVFLCYAFVIPLFATFGLCANLINAIVFMRPKMTPSAFSYLAALSWMDCASCLLILLTAFSRSIFIDSTAWVKYDFQWQTPLFGITTGAANLILACVSLDRLIYLWSGVPSGNGPPKFCRRKIARRMIVGVTIISIVVNIPYFFVFVVNEDGCFYTTPFYSTQHYKFHNWFTFVLLTILPAVFLMIGNAAICIAFYRWTMQSKICAKHCPSNAKIIEKRFKHQMKLTITVLIVITLYMIGELPAHLTSRKSALNLLYGGDSSKVNIELMEHLELIFTTLNAIQLSLNILIYAIINPSFMPEFFTCLRGVSDTCFTVCCCVPLFRRCSKLFKSIKNKSADQEQQPPNHRNSWETEADEQPSTAEIAKNAKSTSLDFNCANSSKSEVNTTSTTTEEYKANQVQTVMGKNDLKSDGSKENFAYVNRALEIETEAPADVD